MRPRSRARRSGIRQQLAAAGAGRALEDEELPERVRLRVGDELGERSEVADRHELLESGVVLRGGRVESVRSVRVVRVPVVGARDERVAAEQLAEPEVLPERPVTGGREHDDAARRDVAQRHLRPPVERQLRLLRIVAAVRDADDRKAGGTDLVDEAQRELAIDLVLADAGGHRDGEVALDVDVVGGDDDDAALAVVAATELLHRREKLRSRLDVAVRRDRDHASEPIRSTSSSRKRSASTSMPACASRGRSVTSHRSTTVRPSQSRDSVSIEMLHSSVVTSVGSMTCATAIASWIGAPSKR
jgi:hypothetical protein